MGLGVGDGVRDGVRVADADAAADADGSRDAAGREDSADVGDPDGTGGIDGAAAALPRAVREGSGDAEAEPDATGGSVPRAVVTAVRVTESVADAGAALVAPALADDDGVIEADVRGLFDAAGDVEDAAVSDADADASRVAVAASDAAAVAVDFGDADECDDLAPLGVCTALPDGDVEPTLDIVSNDVAEKAGDRDDDDDATASGVVAALAEPVFDGRDDTVSFADGGAPRDMTDDRVILGDDVDERVTFDDSVAATVTVRVVNADVDGRADAVPVAVADGTAVVAALPVAPPEADAVAMMDAVVAADADVDTDAVDDAEVRADADVAADADVDTLTAAERDDDGEREELPEREPAAELLVVALADAVDDAVPDALDVPVEVTLTEDVAFADAEKSADTLGGEESDGRADMDAAPDADVVADADGEPEVDAPDELETSADLLTAALPEGTETVAAALDENDRNGDCVLSAEGESAPETDALAVDDAADVDDELTRPERDPDALREPSPDALDDALRERRAVGAPLLDATADVVIIAVCVRLTASVEDPRSVADVDTVAFEAVVRAVADADAESVLSALAGADADVVFVDVSDAVPDADAVLAELAVTDVSDEAVESADGDARDERVVLGDPVDERVAARVTVSFDVALANRDATDEALESSVDFDDAETPEDLVMRGDAVDDGVLAAVAESRGVAVEHFVGAGDAEIGPVAETERELTPEMVSVGVSEPVTLPEPVELTDHVASTVKEPIALTDALDVPLGDAVKDADEDADGESRDDVEIVAVDTGEDVVGGVPDVDLEARGVTEPAPEAEGDGVDDGDTAGDSDTADDAVWGTDADNDPLGVCVAKSDALTIVAVALGETAPVEVGRTVLDFTTDGDVDADTVFVAIDDAVREDVVESVSVPDAVSVVAGVPVSTELTEADGDTAADFELMCEVDADPVGRMDADETPDPDATGDVDDVRAADADVAADGDARGVAELAPLTDTDGDTLRETVKVADTDTVGETRLDVVEFAVAEEIGVPLSVAFALPDREFTELADVVADTTVVAEGEFSADGDNVPLAQKDAEAVSQTDGVRSDDPEGEDVSRGDAETDSPPDSVDVALGLELGELPVEADAPADGDATDDGVAHGVAELVLVADWQRETTDERDTDGHVLELTVVVSVPCDVGLTGDDGDVRAEIDDVAPAESVRDTDGDAEPVANDAVAESDGEPLLLKHVVVVTEGEPVPDVDTLTNEVGETEEVTVDVGETRADTEGNGDAVADGESLLNADAVYDTDIVSVTTPLADAFPDGGGERDRDGDADGEPEMDTDRDTAFDTVEHTEVVADAQFESVDDGVPVPLRDARPVGADVID